MFFLLATIVLNTLLFAFFKVFPRYGIDNLQAIVVNYITCVVTGVLFTGSFPVSTASISEPWLPWAVLLGTGFISVFNLIAYCTRVDGMTVSSVANKLSLVIPVIFSVFLYNESMNAGKIAGIVLALPAVYLSARSSGKQEGLNNLLLPILLFIGSGLLDTLVKYSEQRFLETEQQQAVFSIHVFAAAALAGTLLVTFLLLTGRKTFSWKNVTGGVLLGIPNFFSLYFLIRLLHSDFLQSSAAIPVNNIGILVLSALIAIAFFKEKAGKLRILGILLSIAAILLIALSDHGPA